MKNEKQKVPSLAERAMLVDLSIGVWEGRRKDKAVTNEVILREKSDQDAGSWWTYTIPHSAVLPMLTAANRGRAVQASLTLPWTNDGARILPAKAFMDYTEAMRKCRADFDKAVSDFIEAYPSILEKAPERLGKLLKEEWYPKPEDLRAKFSFDIRFYPLPTAGDFRVDLGAEATAEIKEQIEEQSKAAFDAAMSELWTRLHTCVSKIAQRLGDPDAKFRDSLIENTVELCDLLPKLNVTGSKELDDMRRQVIAELTKQEPEVLRKNKSVRNDTAAKAAKILEQMSGYMGGGAK
jgi:hypothetical protein